MAITRIKSVNGTDEGWVDTGAIKDVAGIGAGLMLVYLAMVAAILYLVYRFIVKPIFLKEKA